MSLAAAPPAGACHQRFCWRRLGRRCRIRVLAAGASPARGRRWRARRKRAGERQAVTVADPSDSLTGERRRKGGGLGGGGASPNPGHRRRCLPGRCRLIEIEPASRRRPVGSPYRTRRGDKESGKRGEGRREDGDSILRIGEDDLLCHAYRRRSQHLYHPHRCWIRGHHEPVSLKMRNLNYGSQCRFLTGPERKHKLLNRTRTYTCRHTHTYTHTRTCTCMPPTIPVHYTQRLG